MQGNPGRLLPGLSLKGASYFIPSVHHVSGSHINLYFQKIIAAATLQPAGQGMSKTE